MEMVSEGFMKLAKSKILKHVVNASYSYLDKVSAHAYRRGLIIKDYGPKLIENEGGIHFLIYLDLPRESRDILTYITSNILSTLRKLRKKGFDIIETFSLQVSSAEIRVRIVYSIPWEEVESLARRIEEEDEKIKRKYASVYDHEGEGA